MVEPNLALLSTNKKRLGLKPYSKLAAAPWIAGNIAYLRDLDFLEDRLKGAGSSDKAEDPSATEEDKKPRNRKRKNKARNQGAGDSTTA